MDWSIQDLGAFGEFVSSIAVIMTLVYLAVQTKQTQKMVRGQTRQAWAEATQEALLTFADSDHIAVIADKLRAAGFPDNKDAVEALDSVENSRFRNYMIANAHRIQSHLYQVTIGICDDVMGPPRGAWVPGLRAFGLSNVADDLERLYDQVEALRK